MSDQHRSISQVLDLLKDEFSNITISKIRFLENQGLLDIQRTQSGYRKFTETDINRLRWILEQQRDHFLPLKVIKERINQQDFNGSYDSKNSSLKHSDTSPQPAPPTTTQPSPQPSPQPTPSTNQSNPLDSGVTSVSLTLDELASTSGLNHSQLMQLQKFGLIEPIDNGAFTCYSSEAVIVAKVAARFLAHGVEPRHLRAYKSAAAREADLMEQLIMPLIMQRTPKARQQSLDMLTELINSGSELRLSLLRTALTNHTRIR